MGRINNRYKRDMRMSGEYITIHKGNTNLHRGINCACKWFDDCEYYIIENDGTCLTFEKYYSLDKSNKALKRTGAKAFMIVSELPLGKFYYDIEESTTDKLFFYYTEQL